MHAKNRTKKRQMKKSPLKLSINQTKYIYMNNLSQRNKENLKISFKHITILSSMDLFINQ